MESMLIHLTQPEEEEAEIGTGVNNNLPLKGALPIAPLHPVLKIVLIVDGIMCELEVVVPAQMSNWQILRATFRLPIGRLSTRTSSLPSTDEPESLLYYR